MYAGREKHVIKCLKCQKERFTCHEFNDLSIPIDSHSSESTTKAEQQQRNLGDILEEHLFQNREILDDDNKILCEHCKVATISERRIEIIQFPPILCLHLLRYKYNRNTGNKTKIRSLLHFPPTITLPADPQKPRDPKKPEENVEYCLTSVIYHLGRSAHGGHYVCDVFDWKDQRWIHCDDEIITPIDQDALFRPPTISILDDDEVQLAKSTKTKAEGTKEKKPSGSKKRKASTDPKASFHQKRKRMIPTRQELEAMDLSDEEEEIEDADEEDESYQLKENRNDASVEDISSSESGDDEIYFEKETAKKKSPQAKGKKSTAKGKHEVICIDDDDADNAKGVKTPNDLKKETKSNPTANKGKDEKTDSKESSSSSSSLFQRQRDVYMLYYVRMDVLSDPALLQKQLALENQTIIQDVDESSRSFQEKVEKYVQKKKVLQEQIEERKDTYQRINTFLAATNLHSSSFSSRKGSSGLSEFHLLPATWLRNWAIGDITTLAIWKDLETDSNKTANTNEVKYVPMIMEIEGSKIEVLPNPSASSTAARKPVEDVQIVEERSSSRKKAPTSIIGNKAKLCPHGYLNINCVEEMKIVSHQAFLEIFQPKEHFAESPSFLMENLDYDLHQENYRCSLCYDQIIQKRQSILKEIENLQHIISQILPFQQEQQKKSFQLGSYHAGRPFYYLSSHSFTLLKKYLQRLEKQQLSKTLQGNNEPIELSSSQPSSPTKNQKKDGSSGSSKELTMEMFYAKKSDDPDENEDELVGTTMPKGQKKNEIEFIRQEIFGVDKKKGVTDLTATEASGPPVLERINENLLCDDHQQLSLTFDKKSFLISETVWEQIVRLFPDALAYPLPARPCALCTDRINRIQKENEEIKLLKFNEMQDEELIQLWKKKKNKNSAGSVFIPDDYRLLQNRIDGKSDVVGDHENDSTVKETTRDTKKSKEKGKKHKKKRSKKETLDGFIVYPGEEENEEEEEESSDEQVEEVHDEMIVDIDADRPPPINKALDREFFLIEQDWLHDWRLYMNQSSSSTSSTPATAASKALKAPPLLTNGFLKCAKHGQLLVNLDVIEAFAPSQHYADLLKQQLLFELQGSEANEPIRSLLEESDLPKSIAQLPKAELVSKSQWNKLLYFHYKYHTFQQAASNSKNNSSDKPKNASISKRKDKVVQDSVLVNLHDDETIDQQDDAEQQPQLAQAQPDPFIVKLLPSVEESDSFEAMAWDFHPSPCLPCLADAFRQHFLTQQCFESENILTYVVSDPLLLIQLLQTLQESHTEKKIPALSEEEMDELFQSLLAKLSLDGPFAGDKDSKETDKGEGGGGGGGEEGNRRRSTRSRTTSMRKKYKKTFLLLSSNDNLALLKLKILESLDIPYGASQLYNGHGQALENGTKKLSDYRFLANQALIVFDARCRRGEKGDGAGGNGDDSLMMDDLDMFHEIDAAIPSQQPGSTSKKAGGRGRKGQEGGFSGTIFSSAAVNNPSNIANPNPSGSTDREVIELFNEDSQELFSSTPAPPSNNTKPATPLPSAPAPAAAVVKEEEEEGDRKRRTIRRVASTTTTVNTSSSDKKSSSRKRRKVEVSDQSEEEEEKEKRMALAAVAELGEQDEDEDFLRAIEESKKYM